MLRIPYQTEEEELNPDAVPVSLPGAADQPTPIPVAEGPDHAAIAQDTISKAAIDGDPVAMTQGLAHKAIADHDDKQFGPQLAPTEVDVKEPGYMNGPTSGPAPAVALPGQGTLSLGDIPRAEAPVYGGPGKAVPQGEAIAPRALVADEQKYRIAQDRANLYSAPTREAREEARLALLEDSVYDAKAHSLLGRIGHAMTPTAFKNNPTQQEEGLRADIKESDAVTANAKESKTKTIGEPVSDGKGGFVQAEQDESGAVGYVPVKLPGALAAAPQGTIAPPQREVTAPVATTPSENSQSGQFAQPVAPAAETAPAFGTKVGAAPKEVKEGELPASPAMRADVTSRIAGNTSLTDAQKISLQFPANYKPSEKDVNERLANIKDLEDAARQRDQDKFNNSIRNMEATNSNLMAQAHLLDLQEKAKQENAKTTQNSDVAYGGLYAQQNYQEAVDAWHASPNFAKDSGLVTEIVNKEHGAQGALSSSMGTALVGSMFGPEGAAVGAGLGAITSMIAGPANGYLETLKKQGISPEGYAAMQAYFNALPARMAYEISIQGVSASALRSSQLIQKVLNTVPAPNTPAAEFDKAFAQYYKPMETLTKGKVKLTAPSGYVPPAKTDFYPNANTSSTSTTKGTTKGNWNPKTGRYE